MSYGVGHRLGSDLALLWCKPAAVALIGPLAWELPYAMGAALKRKKKKGGGNFFREPEFAYGADGAGLLQHLCVSLMRLWGSWGQWVATCVLFTPPLVPIMMPGSPFVLN